MVSKHTKQSKLAFKRDPEMDKEFRKKVARCFYSMNIPFSLVQNRSFVKMIQMMMPGLLHVKFFNCILCICIRRDVAGQKGPGPELLGRRIQAVLQGAEGSLARGVPDHVHRRLDWPARRSHHWNHNWTGLHASIHIASHYHFLPLQNVLTAVNTTGERHTGTMMKTWTLLARDLALDYFKVPICAVTGDNASNMQLSRELMAGQDFFVYGCQAHKLHLACKDLLADRGRDTVMKQVTVVLKTFRTVNNLAAGLKIRKIGRPKLFCGTQSSLSLFCTLGGWG